jgi:hypothetical protein
VDSTLKTLEAERNKLWAEARLKGMPAGTPVRERIDEVTQLIHDHKEILRASVA